MKKRIILTISAMLLAAALTSCGGKQPETTEAVTETTMAETSGTETEIESSSESAAAQEKIKEISGEVVDAAMHSIVIKDDKGKQYELTESDDLDISGLSDGVVVGARVTVTVDASGAVTAIRDQK